MKIEQYVQRSLLLAIGFNYDSIWRDLNTKLKAEKCNFMEAVILIALFFEKSAPVTPSQLAKTLRTSQTNMSHCISRLERLKFLKRTLNENDARSYKLILLPEGRKAALRLMKIIDKLEGHFEKQFGKEEIVNVIRSLSDLSAAYRSLL